MIPGNFIFGFKPHVAFQFINKNNELIDANSCKQVRSACMGIENLMAKKVEFSYHLKKRVYL
jgi:hypothetical protein